MADAVAAEIEKFMAELVERNPGEIEFHQAVHEVAQSIMPIILEHAPYRDAELFRRMTEPDRIVIFRVSWEDDEGRVQVNRAWRVQFNNSIGPYKGGLRFHPSVNQSILKFLGFEQVFKNSLTGLPMGGAKGGSNFDPKGRSDREIMRFCQSMMAELHRHIGEDTDIPAGDIGVGAREIGYLYGQYKRLENRIVGVLTGKGLAFGGSAVRTEATGYGCVYFVEKMLERVGEGLDGRSCVVSGSGNVALHCIEKLIEKKAKVFTASDSSGFIYDKDGIDATKLAWLKELKNVRRGRIREYAETFGAEFHAGKGPWGVECDLAFPCATQNEIGVDDAKALIAGGVRAIAEGANMPTSNDAIDVLHAAHVLFAPGKAANAGGVAVSGLELSQNALRISWTREEVDARLRDIMVNIHSKCVEHGREGEHMNYVKGANVAGFLKVADAMVAYGVV